MTPETRGARPAADLVVEGAREVVSPDPSEFGKVRRLGGVVVATAGERILAVGPMADVAAEVDLSSARRIDAAGALVVPGFVDCHTHVVFGGSRAREYAARLSGDPTALEALGAEIGIAASVGMTRRTADEELLPAAAARLDAMLSQGTTTVESKTGYGLNVEQELRLLRLNARLEQLHPADVVSTLMAAHAQPPGAGSAERQRWIDEIVAEIVPVAAALGAEFNDVFCEEGYFSLAEARRVLQAGLEAGLRPKVHAEQYSRLGGARLAAELRAISADHLNYATEGDLRRLADARTVAVLMPLIDFAVAHPRPVDARRWVDAGLVVGLATDMCPGGWTVSIPLAMQFACRVNRLRPEEALWAATAGGAAAVGRDDRGALEPGRLADLAVIDVPDLDELVYRIGHAPVRQVVRRGRPVPESRGV